MKIYKFLDRNLIFLDGEADSKEEVASDIINKIYELDSSTDKDILLRDILEREEIASTSFGRDIGILHTRSEGLNRTFLALYRLKESKLFPGDENTTRLFFFIGIPKDNEDEHLEILAEFSRNVLDKKFLSAIMKEEDKDRLIELFKETETDSTSSETREGEGYILALLSCPSGMIYTFMAEEILNRLAVEKSKNIKIFLSDDFSKITDQDIEEAEFVIVANKDRASYPRLVGKKVVFANIEDLIKDPENYLHPENLEVYEEENKFLGKALKRFRRV